VLLSSFGTVRRIPLLPGVIYWKIPPWGGISANIIWGKKYEKANRKRGKMLKKKEEWGKKK
jgi:hypothetical protein